MPEEMPPELVEARIANLDAQRRFFDVQAAQKEIELKRSRFFLLEAEAEAHRHRIYSFWGEVSGSSAKKAVEDLGEMARTYPGEKLTIVLNSPGGGVIPGLALFDYIQELKQAGSPVETVSIGYAASMGGVLLQAGHHRVMGANAWLLIHEVSSVGIGKMSELEDEVKFIKRLQAKLLAILAERSKLSETQIKHRWERKDWWLDAQEALKLGFIDEIRA